MRFLLFVVLFAYTAHSGATASHEGRKHRVETPYEAWKQFKKLHGKVYSTAYEECIRMEIFFDTLEEIKRHNKQYEAGKKTFTMAVNPFSDMVISEFNKINGYWSHEYGSDSVTFFRAEPNLTLPDEVNWVTAGRVTPVKSQGTTCGSCYAFASVGALEGLYAKHHRRLIDLSVQQIIDCSVENMGCHGGYPDAVFRYIIALGGGILSWNDRPYVAEKRECSLPSGNRYGGMHSFSQVESFNEEELKKAVAMGPVTAIIDAKTDSFKNYEGGVYYEPHCRSSRNTVNHAVLIVGYGIATYGKTRSQTIKYWLVKNSHGTMWGENGYIKMSRDRDNNCGIATFAYSIK